MTSRYFTLGYIEAALWTSYDQSTPSGGEPLDKNYTVEDIDERSLLAMKEACDEFREACKDDYHQYLEKVHAEGSPKAYAGHDFWLTAAGHGAGFWDRRGIDHDLGQWLSECAKQYGGGDLYVGDDGKIYLAGCEKYRPRKVRERLHRLVSPHGMCKPDRCVEHERDPEIKSCL